MSITSIKCKSLDSASNKSKRPCSIVNMAPPNCRPLQRAMHAIGSSNNLALTGTVCQPTGPVYARDGELHPSPNDFQAIVTATTAAIADCFTARFAVSYKQEATICTLHNRESFQGFPLSVGWQLQPSALLRFWRVTQKPSYISALLLASTSSATLVRLSIAKM